MDKVVGGLVGLFSVRSGGSSVCYRLLLGMFCSGWSCVLAAPAESESGESDGAIRMFNGKNLDGWVIEGKKAYEEGGTEKPIWTVKDGVIHCAGRGYGWLRYDRKFDDFVFHVEYRMLHAKSNSGLGIRCVPYDRARKNSAPSGAAYEIQLLQDGGQPPTARISGSLYRHVAPTANAVKPMGEWNVVDVRCRGTRISYSFNGQRIMNIDQSFYDHLKGKPLSGYLSIQSHSYGVEFRNLWVRPLPNMRGTR